MKIYIVTILFIMLLLGSCAEQQIPVVIQFDSSCSYYDLVPGKIKKEIVAENFVLISTLATETQIAELRQNDCVLRGIKRSEVHKYIDEIQEEFDYDAENQLLERKIKRTLDKNDVSDKDDLEEYLEEKEDDELPTEILSHYQLYVTPDAPAVQALADDIDTIEQAYDEALSWIWVSEEYLNGVLEYWYYPEEFLTETPDLRTNPSRGDIASDCSEQANTLASLLIAIGYEPQNVRVVLGLVNFDGEEGGHAWVEIYEDDAWYPLEATAGAYYDEDADILYDAMPFPHDFFKYRKYPIVQVWTAYNNVYFIDKITDANNAPEHWKKTSRSNLKRTLETAESPQGRV